MKKSEKNKLKHQALMKRVEKNKLKKQILKLIKKKRNVEAGLLIQRYRSRYRELNI